MNKRTYGKCGWCEKTIDTTNDDRELCDNCSKYPSKMEMEKEAKMVKGKKLWCEHCRLEVWTVDNKCPRCGTVILTTLVKDE